MDTNIIQLTAQELAAKTVSHNSLQLVFNNETFAKGPNFSNRMKDQALQYCHKIAQKNLKSLLVESEYFFTVWIQEETSEAIELNAKESSVQESNKTSNLAQSFTKTAENQDINSLKSSTKTIIRRYRGQTYEIEVPDSSISQDSTNNKPRKYRGQYL